MDSGFIGWFVPKREQNSTEQMVKLVSKSDLHISKDTLNLE